MTHRERVIAALNHEPTDRVPVDLGGTRVTGIHVQAYENLVAELGLDLPEPRILDVMQQIVVIDPAVKSLLDVDLEIFDLDVFTPIDGKVEGDRFRDIWGCEWRMPEGGYFYDQDHHPLSGPITVKDIVNHPWPRLDDPARHEGLRERGRALREQTDRAICISVSSSLVTRTQIMRGYEDWYCDMAADQDLLGAMMDAVVDVYLPMNEVVLGQAADYVDIVLVGDDLGHQHGLQISPAAYRKVVKPRQAKVFEAIRRLAPRAFIAFHTDGSVLPVIDDLIELGVQVLNPVQVSAAGMDPAVLKERWGDRLSFWGGVDTQRTLPRGTPDDVRREVAERIRVLGKGGGYICASVHNMLPEVPAANALAMFDEARRHQPPA